MDKTKTSYSLPDLTPDDKSLSIIIESGAINWENRLFDVASKIFVSEGKVKNDNIKRDYQSNEEFEEECSHIKYDHCIYQAMGFVLRYKKLLNEKRIKL